MYLQSLLLFAVSLLALMASYDFIIGSAVQSSTCRIIPTVAHTKIWPYIFGVLVSSDFLLHCAIGVMYILTYLKLKFAASCGPRGHGNTKVKQNAYRRSLMLCVYEVFSLMISSTVQTISVQLNYTNDGVLASILAVFLYELLNPVFYTFTTTAFLELVCKHMRSR